MRADVNDHKRAAFLRVSPASADHLVDSGSQTGQAGQTVDIHLAAVRLSGHQVGPVTLGIKYQSHQPNKTHFCRI